MKDEKLFKVEKPNKEVWEKEKFHNKEARLCKWNKLKKTRDCLKQDNIKNWNSWWRHKTNEIQDDFSKKNGTLKQRITKFIFCALVCAVVDNRYLTYVHIQYSMYRNRIICILFSIPFLTNSDTRSFNLNFKISTLIKLFYFDHFR